jgi:hypothetical protein
MLEKFGEKIKALTFALPIKRGPKERLKSSLKVRKQQHITISRDTR